MNIIIMHQPIVFSYEPLVVEVLSHTNQNAFRKLIDDRLSGFVVPCPLTLFERSSLEPEAYLLFQERKRLAFLPETPPEFNESNLPTDLPLTIQSLCKMLDTRQLEIISKYGSVSRFLENLLLEFESLEQYSRLSK